MLSPRGSLGCHKQGGKRGVLLASNRLRPGILLNVLQWGAAPITGNHTVQRAKAVKPCVQRKQRSLMPMDTPQEARRASGGADHLRFRRRSEPGPSRPRPTLGSPRRPANPLVLRPARERHGPSTRTEAHVRVSHYFSALATCSSPSFIF